ncbi:type I-F CRISPR-associated protein Csy2 [Pseudomonas paraeruginosa]|uniref:type I-F CRISPR-associated protein Csy2 n=1 Tax=Pseudomonas paraeruginosa TaxID=2994495 RepID=UPI00374A4611
MSVTDPEALLLLPRLSIQNANAISSPLTWGFPSPGAFTGFAHALQRRIGATLDIELDGVGIVCHRFEAQVSQPAGKRTQVFNLTRNPLNRDGSSAAIVEEGRAHLEVSLLLGVRGDGLDDHPAQEIARQVEEQANAMRLAGGSILPRCGGCFPAPSAELLMLGGSDEQRRKDQRRLTRRLLPGFALVSREAVLQRHLEDLRSTTPEATTLDALLDLSRLNFEPPATAPEEAASPLDALWQVRDKPGWLVPIPAGYNALSPLYAAGEVRNARDRETPLRFVENLFSLGQWISPHRVTALQDLLWYHQVEPDEGLYRWSTPHFAKHAIA